MIPKIPTAQDGTRTKEDKITAAYKNACVTQNRLETACLQNKKRKKQAPKPSGFGACFVASKSLYFDSAAAGVVHCRFGRPPVWLFCQFERLPVPRRHLFFRLGESVAQIDHHGQDLGDMRRVLMHVGLRDLVVEKFVQRL